MLFTRPNRRSAAAPSKARASEKYQGETAMDFQFEGEIWFWRGPAPWYFVTVPDDHSRDIKAISSSVTYGWGVIPVSVQIGKTTFKTSLFPKEDRYLVPVKATVRKAEGIDEGDTVTVRLIIDL
jgi:hypothetical protein